MGSLGELFLSPTKGLLKPIMEFIDEPHLDNLRENAITD